MIQYMTVKIFKKEPVLISLINLNQMEPMEDQNNNQQFQQIYNHSNSSEDALFDQIITQLQQIVINPQFQKSLTNFMRNHWHIFDQGCNPNTLNDVFRQYQHQLKIFLQNNIVAKVPQFSWERFGELFGTRRHLVDEQILDTLHSLEDIENFKSFVKDYRNSYEEEEQLKVLTIKSNKITQNKTVKGKDNIFNNQPQHLGEKGLKPLPKKKQVKQKTESELLVPELILTVKGMRKG